MDKVYVYSAVFHRCDRVRMCYGTVPASSKDEAMGKSLALSYRVVPGHVLAFEPECAGPFYRAEDVDKLLEEQKPACAPEPVVEPKTGPYPDEAIWSGKKAKRAGWKGCCLSYDGELLLLHVDTIGVPQKWTSAPGDLAAQDWQIVE